MMKIKIVGKRSGQTAPTLENANTLLKTMQQLRGGKGICPRGVYRFKTFEEADEWMMKMLAQSTREDQPEMNLAETIAQKFSALPQVEAVTLAGSRTAGAADAKSDFDLYVYLTAEIPLDRRRGIAEAFAERIEINNQFWEPGDEWIEA